MKEIRMVSINPIEHRSGTYR